MSNTINFYKVTKDENNENELKAVELAGIAQEGIVIDAGGLNNEIGDSIQWFVYQSINNKLIKANDRLNKLKDKDSFDYDSKYELEQLIKDLREQRDLLAPYTPDSNSEYVFIQRLALAILNTKEYRISFENELMNALRIGGVADDVQIKDLSETRKAVVPALEKMLDIKECKYLKPVNVKLNLKEISQLIAIANNVRARWTDKGIKVRQSKTIATETALQGILFTCKNSFKMVVPVNGGKDTRATI